MAMPARCEISTIGRISLSWVRAAQLGQRKMILIMLALTIFFGAWALKDYFTPAGTRLDLVYVGLSVLVAIALVVYGRYFLKKLKHISYL